MRDAVIVWLARLFDRETWWRRCRTSTWTAVVTDRNITYSGAYVAWDSARCRGIAIKGSVVEWPGLSTDVYVHDPPEVLRQHQHGACLQLLRPDDKWFSLHWTRPARTFRESKDYVEQMLWEALNK